MDLKKLQQFGSLKSYQRGHVLFKIGDKDPNMYVILKGVVSVRSKTGDGYKSEILNAGKFFGVTAVILDIPKTDICVIEENDTTLLSIPRTRFESFIMEDQGITMRIMRWLSEQLLEAVGERENIAVKMQKYEPVRATEETKDLYSPLTLEKEQQPQAAEKQTEHEETQAKHGAVADAGLSEMLKTMKTLKGIGIVLPGHGVYISNQWNKTEDLLSPKMMSCPVCGKGFLATYLSRSRLGIPKIGPDMRKKYKEIEPIYFDVYTCSHCGYANFPEDFSKLKKEAAEIVRAELLIFNELPHDMAKNIFEINYVFLKLYLTLFCNVITKDNDLTPPKIWMRLFWLYEDMGETALARTALEKAYNAYVDVYFNTQTFSDESGNEALLLMGELALKLDMEKEATNYFLRVLQSRTSDNMQRRKAEDRVFDIRHKEKAASDAAADKT